MFADEGAMAGQIGVWVKSRKDGTARDAGFVSMCPSRVSMMATASPRENIEPASII